MDSDDDILYTLRISRAHLHLDIPSDIFICVCLKGSPLQTIACHWRFERSSDAPPDLALVLAVSNTTTDMRRDRAACVALNVAKWARNAFAVQHDDTASLVGAKCNSSRARCRLTVRLDLRRDNSPAV